MPSALVTYLQNFPGSSDWPVPPVGLQTVVAAPLTIESRRDGARILFWDSGVVGDGFTTHYSFNVPANFQSGSANVYLDVNTLWGISQDGNNYAFPHLGGALPPAWDVFGSLLDDTSGITCSGGTWGTALLHAGIGNDDQSIQVGYSGRVRAIVRSTANASDYYFLEVDSTSATWAIYDHNGGSDTLLSSGLFPFTNIGLVRFDAAGSYLTVSYGSTTLGGWAHSTRLTTGTVGFAVFNDGATSVVNFVTPLRGIQSSHSTPPAPFDTQYGPPKPGFALGYCLPVSVYQPTGFAVSCSPTILPAGQVVSVTINNPGTGYGPGDTIVIAGGNTNAHLNVDTADPITGAVTGFSMTVFNGLHYVLANGVTTTTNGLGTGFRVNITAVKPDQFYNDTTGAITLNFDSPLESGRKILLSYSPKPSYGTMVKSWANMSNINNANTALFADCTFNDYLHSAQDYHEESDPGVDASSEWLVFRNFNFAIPTGATIAGFNWAIRASSLDANNVIDPAANSNDVGAIEFANVAMLLADTVTQDGTSSIPADHQVFEYQMIGQGGNAQPLEETWPLSTDTPDTLNSGDSGWYWDNNWSAGDHLWGLAITRSDTNNTGFGFAIMALGTAGNSTPPIVPLQAQVFEAYMAVYYTGGSPPLPTPQTAVTSTANPARTGTLIMLTATVTGGTFSPTGTVNFYDGGNPLVTGLPVIGLGGAVSSAAFLTSALTPGVHHITATYSGDGNYAVSTSSTFDQQINNVVLTALPAFALLASYSQAGDEALPSASLSSSPLSTTSGHPVTLFWNTANLAKVRIIGSNGIDPVFDSGLLTTTGSGTYSWNSGFTHTILLTMHCYDRNDILLGVIAQTTVAIVATSTFYVVDGGNSVVRQIDSNGIITAFAGTGVAGFSGDGGPAVAATLNVPYGTACDAQGNVYITDVNNNRIRCVNTQIAPITIYGVPINPGDIGTVVGTGVSGYTGDTGPATAAEIAGIDLIFFDSNGNLYIADFLNSVIRKVATNGTITTVAGAGTAGYSGDSGPALAAQLDGPNSAITDAAGNLYIADMNNNRIRAVNTQGTSQTLFGVLIAAGNIATIAGTGTPGYSGNGGAAVSATLNSPLDVKFDAAGNLYISDDTNNVVRVVSPAGTINAFAGNNALGGGYSGDGGAATGAALNGPSGLWVDANGSVFITDTANNVVREVSSGIISTYAGNFAIGGTYSGDTGLATAAGMFQPTGVEIFTS